MNISPLKTKKTIAHDRLVLAAICSSLFILSACSTNNALLSAQRKYRAGNFSGAHSTIARESRNMKLDSRDAVIIKLEHASMARTAGDQNDSLAASRDADQAIQIRDQKALVELGKEAGAMLTNLNSLPYNASPSEKIMGASLLALEFAAAGDIEKARSAVKLAKNREADYIAKYQAQIEKEKNSLKEAASKNPKVNLNLDYAKIDAKTADLERSVNNYAPYANFSVPYAELIAGIILGGGSNPDVSRSRESFARCLAAYPNNESLRRAASASLEGTTHIVIEDGVAPSLDAYRFDLPLKINSSLVVLSAAFPKFAPIPLAGNEVDIVAGGAHVTPSLLCDFDRIAATEYKRKLPGTIARTMAASTLKAVASYVGQEVVRQKNGYAADALALVSAGYNIASAQADQRIWATLPKQVRYAMISTPSDRKIQIGGRSVELPKASTVLVVVGSVNGAFSVQTIGLDTNTASVAGCATSSANYQIAAPSASSVPAATSHPVEAKTASATMNDQPAKLTTSADGTQYLAR